MGELLAAGGKEFEQAERGAGDTKEPQRQFMARFCKTPELVGSSSIVRGCGHKAGEAAKGLFEAGMRAAPPDAAGASGKYAVEARGFATMAAEVRRFSPSRVDWEKKKLFGTRSGWGT